MRRAVLIAGRELKNEQGTQEVGEDGAGSPLSQPEPVGEINTGRQTKIFCFQAPAALFCLLLCLGCDSYSCARRDAQVKAHLCYRGAVNTSASPLTEVMHILLNDSQVLVIAEVTHMSCMSVNVCGCTLFNFEFLILISKQ